VRNEEINKLYETLLKIGKIKGESKSKIIQIAISFKNSLNQQIFRAICKDFNAIDIFNTQGSLESVKTFSSFIFFREDFKKIVNEQKHGDIVKIYGELTFLSPESRLYSHNEYVSQNYLSNEVMAGMTNAIAKLFDMNGNNYVKLHYDYLISAMDIQLEKLPLFISSILEINNDSINQFVVYILRNKVNENLSIQGLVFFIISHRIMYSAKQISSNIEVILKSFFLEILEFLFLFINTLNENFRYEIESNVAQNLKVFIAQNEIDLLRIIINQTISNDLIFFYFKLKNYKCKRIMSDFRRKGKNFIYSELSKFKKSLL
jgi:hypothetical protein